MQEYVARGFIVEALCYDGRPLPSSVEVVTQTTEGLLVKTAPGNALLRVGDWIVFFGKDIAIFNNKLFEILFTEWDEEKGQRAWMAYEAAYNEEEEAVPPTIFVPDEMDIYEDGDEREDEAKEED